MFGLGQGNFLAAIYADSHSHVKPVKHLYCIAVITPIILQTLRR